MGLVETLTTEVDVLLIGAGFGSFSLWKKLKDQAHNPPLTLKIYEQASASGGVWHWHTYPGIRVDSDSPTYQHFSRDLYTTFEFTERFPGGAELALYFQHMEKTWNITPDISYNKCVTGATWEAESRRWRVRCEDGSVTYCRWLVPALGLSSNRHTPVFEGLERFQGQVYHTGVWPREGVDVRGKRVAVIGTGASGVQLIQEIGDEVGQLTIYQRTPNLCIPMRQAKLDQQAENEKKQNGTYDEIYAKCRTTFAGLPYDIVPKDTFDDTPEDREKFFQSLWDQGGFPFWLANYQDSLYSQPANDEVYKFWRTQTLKRIKNPQKAHILAPEKAPHPWGTKRPSLEQRYYEVVDQDHITLIDVKTSPITAFSRTGITTTPGDLREFDIIILATGYDIGASIAALDLVGLDGTSISQYWSDGIKSSFGIAVPNFPNLLTMYGPQAPTAFANGPSVLQYQAEWVADTIGRCTQEGITYLEARKEAEEKWGEKVRAEWEKSLFPKARSWYQRSNIPGKKVEGLFWFGGLRRYLECLRESCEGEWQGWVVKTEEGRRDGGE